jgi:GPH family glycoside/pentoside/hexuronide:cation symporter
VVQPDSALAMIQNIYVWGPLLVWMIAVVVLALYKLDRKYDKIMEELKPFIVE